MEQTDLFSGQQNPEKQALSEDNPIPNISMATCVGCVKAEIITDEGKRVTWCHSKGTIVKGNGCIVYERA